MTLPGIFMLFLLVMASDLAGDGRYNYAGHVEFPGYHTYLRLTIRGAAQLMQLTEQRLRAALDKQDAQLSRMGLVSADQNADLVLLSRVAAIDSNTTTTGQAATVQEDLEKTVARSSSNYPPADKTNSSG